MRHRRQTYKIKVYCSGCSSQLFKYEKEGKGHLVKCYLDNIVEDHTTIPMHCPDCDTLFAREAVIHNRPAYKIIQGKVFVRR
jgi:hypothetical protein